MAGDVDNDGVADYLVSAPFNSEIHKWNGKVYLFASQQVPYEISGTVTYFQTDKPIPGAPLYIDSVSTAIDSTDDLGQYRLVVRGKQDHSVYVKKPTDEHAVNAITSYDAALIARITINLEVADTINLKAADVNFDSRINMFDAANTLRYAVELPPLDDSHAGEWTFIPELMQYDSVTADKTDQNYTGFVTGDVDLNWQSPDSGLIKVATDSPVTRTIAKDETYYFPIMVNPPNPFISFDLDISYNQQDLNFVGIQKTGLTRDFQLVYNVNLKNRLIIGGYTPKQICDKGVLLYLIFKPVQTGLHQTNIVTNKFLVDNKLLELPTIHLKIENDIQLPEKFELLQNYPNPFNHSTIVPLFVAEKVQVQVTIFNMLGKQIRTLLNEQLLPGRYQLNWDGKDEFGNAVTSGIYICKAICSTGNEKIKIIHIK